MRRTDVLPAEDLMPPSRREGAPPDEAVKREQTERLRVAVGELPEREREVFLLRQNGDLTYAAIAEIVDAPVGTVKTRMRSALARLRGILLETVPTEPRP